MKKRLKKIQFQEIIKTLDVGEQTIQITYGVLVEGKTQSSYVQLLNLTKGAISQAVNRVWGAHLKNSIPEGYEQLSSVVLPERQAYIVKKWAKEAEKKINENSSCS